MVSAQQVVRPGQGDRLADDQWAGQVKVTIVTVEQVSERLP